MLKEQVSQRDEKLAEKDHSILQFEKKVKSLKDTILKVQQQSTTEQPPKLEKKKSENKVEVKVEQTPKEIP